jgi:hypothetical protein
MRTLFAGDKVPKSDLITGSLNLMCVAGDLIKNDLNEGNINSVD